MATRPRKLPRKTVVDKNLHFYCRKCMRTDLGEKDFYTRTDTLLDSNGYMSICKDCCNTVFDNSYTLEHNFEKALLRTCKILNVAWVPTAVESARNHLSKMMDKGKETTAVFGIYKSKVSSMSSMNLEIASTYNESVDNAQFIENDPNVTDDETFNKYLSDFWEPGLSFEQYEFLESELGRYKRTHKCDTATEESLLRQICFAELDIRNSRVGGGSPDTAAIKRLQELMKTASVDPAKTSLANSGKAQDTFSSFVKIIEENEPAEYYSSKEKNVFKDYDNIDFYFKKYVTRPLKNFITQSRDFNVKEDDEGTDDFDINQGLE